MGDGADDETTGSGGGAGEDSPLRVLLHVQDLDVALDQLAFRRRELPERRSLASIEQAIVDLEAELGATGAQIASLAERQGALEQQIGQLTERIHAIEARLKAGGDYRASQAMSTESDSLARQRSELEDAELEIMGEIEPLESAVAAGEARLAALRVEREEAVTALVAAEGVVDAEADTIAHERATAAAGLPEPLAATYERLRAHLGGVGAARLVDGSCSGCHLRLPSSERERVVHAAPGEIAFCDQCGRILVA